MIFSNSLSWINKRSWVLMGMMVLCATLMYAQDKTAASVYNEGLTLLKEKKYEEGLPLLEEALQLAEEEGNEQVIGVAKKNGAVAAFNVGNNLRKAKQYEEALTYFEKGIELNPDYSANYGGKAICLEKGEDKGMAAVAYLEAAEKNASKADRAAQMVKRAQNIVGKLFTADDFEGALSAGMAFLEKKEDNSEVNYYVARAYMEKGENETAIPYIDRAIEIAKDTEDMNDKYYVAKGKIFEDLGKNAEAVEAYKLVTDDKYLESAQYKIEKLGGSK